MKLEEMFKNGVTPKEGPDAGKRYKVLQIYPERVIVRRWNDEDAVNEQFPLDALDLWRPPKTLFESDSMPATVGNLKKAIAAAGLGDDTRIKVPISSIWFEQGVADASAKVVTVDGKPAILFYY